MEGLEWKRGLRHPKGFHPLRQAGQLLPATHSCVARELRIPFTFLNVGGKKIKGTVL